nr:hypothetical protein KPHV_08460 [Kitasatospora purpeofusca]
MGDYLDRIQRLMPPPERVPRVDWGAAPVHAGFRFPSDYRAFVDRYGAGSVGNELGILTPLMSGSWFGATNGFEAMTGYTEHEVGRAMREMREVWPDNFPFSFHPEPDGLMAWARNPNGDVCFWHMNAPDADAWPVYVWERGRRSSEAWSRYDHGMTGVVHDALTGAEPLSELLVSAAPQERQTWFGAA